MIRHSLPFACLVLGLFIQQSDRTLAQYLPLETSFEAGVAVIDTTFSYGATKRSVPLRIYLPKSDVPHPVILFSHGLGGSREASPFLGKHWANRGYCVVFMQHAGSDRDVMKNAPRFQRLRALKGAINSDSVESRNNDVHATIDQLEKLNGVGGQFEGQLDLERLGMSGHSFGAITTQAVSGQNFGLRGQAYTDSRIKAAIAMSPSMPALGGTPKTFSSVKIPWLLMTGTDDDSPIGRRTDAKSRREVFKSLPTNGHSFELVLHEGTHAIFSGRPNRLPASRNSKQHLNAIKAVSAAFWDAYLMKVPEALAWLHGDEVKKVLEDRDLWLTK